MAWLQLPTERPGRELHWLSLMPATTVTAVGHRRPVEEGVGFAPLPYRRLTRRFVEAGSLAWLRGLDSLPGTWDWIASLELMSLVTGQASALAARRGCRQAVLVWENNTRQPLYRLPPYRQAMLRARGADLVLCFIEAAKVHCVELGIPAERCAVVLPGIDLELFTPAAEPVAAPIAAFVSPLLPNKGIDRVLDAFDRVRSRLPDARLVVVGRGPLEGLVAERAEASGGSVAHLGGRDRAGVAEVLRAAAVFVTAPRPTRTWNEQFGLAYLEAMACGLPVVTTACGTNHEAVHPPNLLVEDDVEALAAGLLSFLEDPALRAEVGLANRAHVVEHHELRRQTALMGEAFAAATA